MSGYLNKVFLIGNLGADPEIRSLKSGNKVANLRLATTKKWKDDKGDKQEKTEWHYVIVFNDNLCDFVEKYLIKGSKVYVEGELRTRNWQDKDGNERYTTEILIQTYGGQLQLLSGPFEKKEEKQQTKKTNKRKTYVDNEEPF